jgi:hypothetical protein
MGCFMTLISDNPSKHGLTDHESTGGADDSAHRGYYADLMETMFGAFEQSLSLCEIVDVVDRCRSDLAGSPPGAMPELLDRLARHRLSELAAAR